MNIRQARKDDFLSLQSLSKQLGYDYPLDKVRAKIKKIDSNEDHILLVAEDPESNRIIGYAHAQVYEVLFSDTFLNLLGIVVDESCRGSGVGTAFITELEKYCLKKGCQGIRACSGAVRKKAHNFYRSNGFDDEKEQIRFFNDFHKEDK